MNTTLNNKKETATKLKKVITAKQKNGYPIIIEISLDDDCKNGHADFSITGSTFRKKEIRDFDTKMINGIEYSYECGGCIHDEILQVMPELKIFVNLHLSDAKGAPMYAIENGYYHLKNSSIETVKNYLRITDKELNELQKAENSTHFAFIMESLQVPKRWEIEAKEAIKVLEDMTGKVFVDTSTRYQYTGISQEQKKNIETKLSEGYFSEDKKEERKNKAKDDKLKKQIDSITKDRDKEISKANNEFRVKLAVLNSGLPLDNFIYYTHSNTGVFNWKGYEAKITEDQLTEFTKNLHFSKLPEGVVFKLDTKNI